MKARAAKTEATRDRVLAVTAAQLKSRFRSEIRLEDIARDAEVTVQTVLNVFGTRAALLDEGLSKLLTKLRAHRLRAEPGDDRGAVSALIEHYEQFGDWVIRNLAEEGDPELLAIGRAGHREWVARQFGQAIAKVDRRRREELIDRLVCVCDVYTWKVLRRDMGRSQARTEATILAMVGAILGGLINGAHHDP